MTLRLVISFILCFQLLLQGRSSEVTEIISAQIIFRHGERPVETTWPPTSQLTQGGKKQMYGLGRYIRDRYADFLQKDFNQTEIFIVSSEVDRSIISANLVAYGIYKDFSTTPSWSKKEAIQFEPIPVKTIPQELDKYLNHNFRCPRMLQLFSSSLNNFLENSSQTDENLANIITNLRETVGNGSVSEDTAGFDSNNIDEVPLNGFAMAAFVTIFSNYINALDIPQEACKLNGGSLLEWVVQGFRKENRRKLTLHSAHDLPIYTIMKLLDVYDPFTLTNPPFGSALIFELHQDSQQRELVKIFYRNSTEGQPRELQFAACGALCLFSDFLRKTNDLIPMDYAKECIAE